MPDLYLSPEHRHMLEKDSSIGEGAIRARGYYTCSDPAHLALLGFAPDQCAMVSVEKPTLVMPIHGVDRDIVGFQHRPDAPREKDGRLIKYESLPGKPPRIDIPPIVRNMIDDPSHALWITEGIKKADAAGVRGLCCIDLVGVWLFRGLNSKGGSTELADWEGIAIKGRIIYIAYDNDVMSKPGVRQALRRLATFLKRRGAQEVRPVLIPSAGDGKTGLDDFFAGGGTTNALYDCVNKELLTQSAVVVNSRQLPDITAEALEALGEWNDPPTIFQRAGELTRIITDKRGITKIETLTMARLRNALGKATNWVRVEKKVGPVDVFPPKDVVEDLIALGEWPQIHQVIALTMAPVLSPKGTLSMDPGYCLNSQFYITAKEPVPEWQGTVAEAVEFLLGREGMLGDFPFAGDSDRAHALALMLLPIVRPAISGPTPLHLIDAPVQGTGKSKLATVCLMPTVGDNVSATAGTKDEEEWRKKIASSLLEGRLYLFLDNLSRKVDSDALAGVLTSTEWNDRALSTMTNINVPVRCVWVATTNNAELSRDILRRTIWIRLDAKVERPEDRTQFHHENIEVWVSENRPQILSALCKLVSTWLAAGKPSSKGRRLGSFEEWSKVLGGILECVGVQGFLGNIEDLRATANSEDISWAGFYYRWHVNTTINYKPVKASELLEEFAIDEGLSGMLGDKGEMSRKTRLGYLLKRRVGVRANGLWIEAAPSRAGSASFRICGQYLEPVERSDGSDGASGGGLPAAGGGLSPIGGGCGGGCEQQIPLISDSNGTIVVGVGGGLDQSYTHTGAPALAHAHVKEGASNPHQPPPQVQKSNQTPQTPTTTPTTTPAKGKVVI